MTTLFDATRFRNRNRSFGRGVLPPPLSKSPVAYISQADLDWAAAELNRDATDYVVVESGTADMEEREAEAAWQDSFAGWDVPPKRRGVRLDDAEEAARYGVAVDSEGFPLLTPPNEYEAYQAAYSRFLDGRGPHPDTIA